MEEARFHYAIQRDENAFKTLIIEREKMYPVDVEGDIAGNGDNKKAMISTLTQNCSIFNSL